MVSLATSYLIFVADSYYGLRNMVPLKTIEPASISRTFRRVRDWIACCTSTHQDCRKHFKELLHRSVPPSRVIDVGTITDSPAIPRLVDTGNTSVTYVALSHRWAHTQPLITTLENFDSHQLKIPEQELPPTFKDAIEMTRQLHIRYLWIDSLCIIQDDQEDWRRESRIMGDIFAGASVTLAAVDAVDEHGIDHGMLSRQQDPLAVTLRLPFDGIPLPMLSKRVFGIDNQVYVWKYRWFAQKRLGENAIYERSTITLRPRTTSLYWKVRQSRWYKRGWILQERLLSNRVVYFMREKIYWGCFSKSHEEEEVDCSVPTRSSMFLTSTTNMAQQWKTIVSEYVSCHLSRSSDRLVAIEGISRILETCSSLKIYAGILNDGAAESLLWYTKHKPLAEFEDFHAPSWTWASLDGVVSFETLAPSGSRSRSLVRDVGFSIRPVCGGEHIKGQCSSTCLSGHATLTCPVGNMCRSTRLKDARMMGFPDEPLSREALRPLLGSLVDQLGFPLLRFDPDGQVKPNPCPTYVPDHSELLVDEGGIYVGVFIPDMERQSDDNIPLVCASIRVWEGVGDQKYGENSTIDVIGLEAVDKSKRLFRRVGRGRILCNAWLPSCIERGITII